MADTEHIKENYLNNDGNNGAPVEMGCRDNHAFDELA